jgi:hypothetical protein
VFLPEKITQLQAELSDLQAKTAAAILEVDQFAVEVGISEAEAKAALAKVLGHELLSDAAVREVESAKTEIQAADSEARIAHKNAKAAQLDLKVAQGSRQSLFRELLYTYRRCLAAGFDPHATPKRRRRDGIFSRGVTDPKHSRAHRALRELAGMVRWIHLLNPKLGKKHHAWLLQVTQQAWLEYDPPEGKDKERVVLPLTRKLLLALADRLQRDFEAVTSGAGVEIRVQTFSPPTKSVTWHGAGRTSGLRFDVELTLRKAANLGRGLNSGWRHYVLLSRSAVVWPAAAADTTAFPVAMWPPIPTNPANPADPAGTWAYRADSEANNWRGGARVGINAKAAWKDTSVEQDAGKALLGASHTSPVPAVGVWHFEVGVALNQGDVDKLRESLKNLKNRKNLEVKLVILSVRE